MPELTHAPAERAAFRDRDRITVPQSVRGAVTWAAEMIRGGAVTFELRETGHARILPGAVFEARIKQALDASDAASAKRLPLVLIPGKWEDSHRLPIPELVMDRLFGAGQHAASVVLWGHDDVIELWNDARWNEAVELMLADGPQYLSNGG